MAQFARSLRHDWAAVTEPWSQGPVKAAVTGIKRLRRLWQRRGNGDLLRLRIAMASDSRPRCRSAKGARVEASLRPGLAREDP